MHLVGSWAKKGNTLSSFSSELIRCNLWSLLLSQEIDPVFY